MSEYRLVRHRGQFSIAWTEPGLGRRRVATGQNERGAAEAVASRIWRERSKPVTERVADLWEPYKKDRIASGVAPKRFNMWKALEPHFGYKLGKAITKQDCRDYAAARRKLGRSPDTVRTELEALRACLRWHYGKDAPQIVTPPPAKPRDRFLTKDEADKLLAHIETPHVKLFVELAFATGARMGALLDLTWDRVDWRAGTIDLRPAGRDITNKRRTVVPITARVRPLLELAHQGALSEFVIEYGGGPVKSVKTAITAAARRSGVKCSAHDFRRSAGRWMAEGGASMDEIAQYLGHTSTRITAQVYARFSPRFLARAASALEW